jgi:hypothetical protein
MKLRKRPGDLVAGAVLWAMGATIVQQSTTWPVAADVAGDPTVFPRALAALMFLSGFGLVAFRLSPPQAAEGSGEHRPSLTLTLVGVTALLALSLNALGLVLAGFLYLLAAQRIAGARWRVALPFAIGTPVLVWLLFVTALNVPLPKGELWSRFVS